MSRADPIDGVVCICGEVAEHGKLKAHLREHAKEELVLMLAGWLCIHEPMTSRPMEWFDD